MHLSASLREPNISRLLEGSVTLQIVAASELQAVDVAEVKRFEMIFLRNCALHVTSATKSCTVIKDTCCKWKGPRHEREEDMAGAGTRSGGSLLAHGFFS